MKTTFSPRVVGLEGYSLDVVFNFGQATTKSCAFAAEERHHQRTVIPAIHIRGVPAAYEARTSRVQLIKKAGTFDAVNGLILQIGSWMDLEGGNFNTLLFIWRDSFICEYDCSYERYL